MKKHRKALAAGMIAFMYLTACGTGSSTGSESQIPSGGSNTGTEAGGTYEMCYIATVEDEWLSELMNDMSAAAAENDVRMEIRHAGNDTSKVIESIEQAKDDGKDAVIVNMAYSDDATACVEAAGDMKLVFVNRVPDASDYGLLGENAAAVASDENLAGTFQGEFLTDYFKEKGQTDIRYLMLQGPLDLSHSRIRSEKPLSVMEEAGLNPIETETIKADYSRGQAQEAVTKFLSGNPEFDCIISNNDAMAIGAILALENAGIDPASLPIVGIDATADAAQAILDGKMSMSVYQSAEGQAQAAVKIAKNLVDGNPIADGTGCEVSNECENLLYVPFVKVTAENVQDYVKKEFIGRAVS